MLTMKTVLSVVFLATLLFQGTTGYKVTDHYAIGGTGGFDYVAIDSSARRLYVSHATQVEVLDADSGKLIGTIADTPGVHGAAIASAFKHGFTSNGRENKVSIFDPTTLALIKKIDVGKGPDGIYYDPESKRVFTNNHGSHDITAIDAKTGEVVGTVQAKGDGEQAVIGDDVIYVNLEDTAEVVAFDPKSLEVKKRFPIGVGVDYAGFDPDAKLIFFSCGAGTLSIYREKSADVYEDAGAVTTQPTAKTMAFDPKTKKIFLPAAEYTEGPPAQPGGRPTRTQKPGSFLVVVVAKS